nr:cholesterol 7-alpha-monooxygenase [Quercus suber]
MRRNKNFLQWFPLQSRHSCHLGVGVQADQPCNKDERVLLGRNMRAQRTYTTLNYYWTLQHSIQNPAQQSGKKLVASPQIPYTLPFFGNTFAFLNSTPGAFWSRLFSWHPHATGVCTLLLGGKKTHILYAPPAVQALFRARTPSREVFEREMYAKVFEMPPEQVDNAFTGKHFEHEMNTAYLAKPARVNELTEHFTRVLEDVLNRDATEIVKKGEVCLYDWLRDRMFTASVTALLGEKLLQMYPDYCKDFYGFDNDFMSFIFELPSFVMGDGVKRRKRIFDNLEKWSLAMHEQSGGAPVDPEGPAWEPLFGSRLNRARQLDYKNRNLNTRTGAALDLGITFALGSNAVPATGWMLMNVLNPDGDATLLPRLLTELRAAEQEDGSIDVPTLIAQPLLQSLWTETLRLYTDVLVSRNLPEDLTVPLDEDGKRELVMKKGSNVFAPSWVGHHDAAAWSHAGVPHDKFHAERFLVEDPATGKQIFSLNGTNGKFFPFGGGRTICPGRVFAKQEALGALALILLRFEFEVKGFVDKDQKSVDAFPGFAKAFAGSGALAPGGDLKVKIKRRA